MIKFFQNKWVIQLLGIIALSLLIWFFGPLIAIAGHTPLESDFVRLLVILVMVLLWGLNNLRIQLKANQANAQMATDLVSPADAGSTQIDKDVDADVAKIANNFDEALQTLKMFKVKIISMICLGKLLSVHRVLEKRPHLSIQV